MVMPHRGAVSKLLPLLPHLTVSLLFVFLLKCVTGTDRQGRSS